MYVFLSLSIAFIMLSMIVLTPLSKPIISALSSMFLISSSMQLFIMRNYFITSVYIMPL